MERWHTVCCVRYRKKYSARNTMCAHPTFSSQDCMCCFHISNFFVLSLFAFFSFCRFVRIYTYFRVHFWANIFVSYLLFVTKNDKMTEKCKQFFGLHIFACVSSFAVLWFFPFVFKATLIQWQQKSQNVMTKHEFRTSKIMVFALQCSIQLYYKTFVISFRHHHDHSIHNV